MYTDADLLYEAAKKSISSSKWKYGSQLFEMNMLLEVAKLQQCLGDHSYTPQEGTKFVIRERGKVRNVTSIPPVDKTINHLLCDEMLTPRMDSRLIHDNAASRVNKGTAFHRRRFIQHLAEFYRRNGSNDGYILLGDFKNYYGSIDRKKAREYMLELMGIEDPELEADTEWLLETILPDGMGVNLGGQPSQNVGISFANRIDTLVKTVEGQRFYGRYSDDFYCIHESREYLVELREKISGEASKIGLTVHPNKTYISKLSTPFRHLQIKYHMTENGKIIRQIHPKAVTRERRRLKAYKHLLEAGRISQEDIENAFKGWLSDNYTVMSARQIVNLIDLYEELFKRRIKWKKSKLNYLTAKRSRISP